MRFIYPAIVRPVKDKDGWYEAVLPDLEGCCAKGFSIDDCLEEANAAALNWITIELEEEHPFLPPVSDPEDLDPGPDGFIRQVCITYKAFDGWEE